MNLENQEKGCVSLISLLLVVDKYSMMQKQLKQAKKMPLEHMI